MIAVKTSEFATQIESGQTVGISFHYYTPKNNKFVTSLMKKVLERNDKIFLHDTVITVMRELIINAVKANSKRYYFLKNNLDIGNESNYQQGMEHFKDFIIVEKEKIEESLRNHNLKVELYLRKSPEGIRILIRNNTPILPKELNRIQTRIETAKGFQDFTDVYDEVTDDSEGEGLGLLLTMLFLRNSGIGEQSFKINTDGKITQTTLVIPSILKPQKITSEIEDRIAAEVEDLPSMPEHVHAIQALCATPEVQLKLIADKIMADPALTAAVLRLANSAGFISRKKAETVLEAITIIGMRNLSAIIAAASARSILDTKFSAYKEIWEHCNKVAFYAREFANRHGRQKIAEQVVLASMLHDLGKIVLLATTGALGEWISDVAENRAMKSNTIIEEISIGISHSQIGERIARKWNMPEYVSETIRYHHSPILAPDQFREIIFITYLANEMCHIEKGRYGYEHIETDTLTVFDIAEEDQFVKIHASLREQYSQKTV
jgi:HD-like signal output (HDOD) protein